MIVLQTTTLLLPIQDGAPTITSLESLRSSCRCDLMRYTRSIAILLPSPVTLALTVAVLLRSCWRAKSFSRVIRISTRRLVILPSRGRKSDIETEPLTGWLHNTKPKTISAVMDDSSPAMKRLVGEKMKEYRNHRIIAPPAIHPCGNKRAMVTEHCISVPLDHVDLENTTKLSLMTNSITVINRIDSAFDTLESFTDRPRIELYFCTINLVTNSDVDELYVSSLSDMDIDSVKRAEIYLKRGAIDPSQSMIYLQGGPGFGCAAPVSGLSLSSSKSSWASAVLLGEVTNLDGSTFDHVILMDQRGTGRSSPITKQTLSKMFPDLFLLDSDVENESDFVMKLKEAQMSLAVTEASSYLTKFRADSIIRDAEWIREALCRLPTPVTSKSTEDADDKDDRPPRPWGAALGQSFGGFCLMTYLSTIMHPPRMCLFTGGIAPMNTPIREVYDRLWVRVEERNQKYYHTYPGDVVVVKRIVRRLIDTPALLPGGGMLTARRFLQLGLGLGGSPGSAFANLHSVISSAFLDDNHDELSCAFLKKVEQNQSFDDAPLYFLLHESIYADGPLAGPTKWAAHSSYECYKKWGNDAHLPVFDYSITPNDDSRPILFFGEMVFPWMTNDYEEVSGRGMVALSEALATKDDWLPLFDAKNMRRALIGGDNWNEPPKTKAASVSYYDDMYVDFDCAMKLVKRDGPMEGVKVWITNEFQHSGLRDDGANILSKLVSMAKGTLHVPS